MSVAKNNDGQHDEKIDSKSKSTPTPIASLDETPTFHKIERSKLGNELYDYFEKNNLLQSELNFSEQLLIKLNQQNKFNQKFKSIDDVNKFIYTQNISSPLFQKSPDQRDIILISQIPHNSTLWSNLYIEAKKNKEWGLRVSLWNLIQHQTVNLITNVWNLPLSFQDQLQQCTGYGNDNKPKGPSSGLFKKNDQPKYLNTMELGTNNMDCIITGIKLKKAGFNPVILNLANQHSPAAATHRRSEGGTQEENIFKRSSLYLSLWPHRDQNKNHNPAYHYNDIFKSEIIKQKEKKENQSFYPMHDKYGGIYSKNVYCFRGSEASGYAILPLQQRVILSFIAVAARVHNSTIDPLNKDEIQAYKHKIRTIYRIAYDNGHDSIVLGAMGCGIFHNPPEQVAKLFYDVLKEEFDGYFARIVFAILWDHNSMPKLVESFMKYFPKNDKVFETLIINKILDK